MLISSFYLCSPTDLFHAKRGVFILYLGHFSRVWLKVSSCMCTLLSQSISIVVI